MFLAGGKKRWEGVKVTKTIFLENKGANGGVLGMDLGEEGRIEIEECYFRGNRGARKTKKYNFVFSYGYIYL